MLKTVPPAIDFVDKFLQSTPRAQTTIFSMGSAVRAFFKFARVLAKRCRRLRPDHGILIRIASPTRRALKRIVGTGSAWEAFCRQAGFQKMFRRVHPSYGIHTKYWLTRALRREYLPACKSASKPACQPACQPCAPTSPGVDLRGGATPLPFPGSAPTRTECRPAHGVYSPSLKVLPPPPGVGLRGGYTPPPFPEGAPTPTWCRPARWLYTHAFPLECSHPHLV